VIRYLTVEEVLSLHRMVIEETGGNPGILDMGKIESSVTQPQMTFGGVELYPSLAEKAAILSFSLNRNHAFSDGNKRISYVAMRTFLQLNGYDLIGSHDEKEKIILAVAASKMEQEDFFQWVREHIQPLSDGNDRT